MVERRIDRGAEEFGDQLFNKAVVVAGIDPVSKTGSSEEKEVALGGWELDRLQAGEDIIRCLCLISLWEG